MPKLATGTYEPKRQVQVTVWPKADVHGDGEPVYVDETDGAGNFIGRNVLMDGDQEIREYSPPAGFVNVPSRDAGADGVTDNWVRDNGRGAPQRNKAGHAVSIKPGTALVEYPDGTHELLIGDYAQAQFAARHDQVTATTGEG